MYCYVLYQGKTNWSFFTDSLRYASLEHRALWEVIKYLYSAQSHAGAEMEDM